MHLVGFIIGNVLYSYWKYRSALQGLLMYSLVVYSCVLFIASFELYTSVPLVDMKQREQDVTFRRRQLMSVSTKWFGTACVCSVVSAARPRATDVLLKTDTDGYGARRSDLSVHLVTDRCWQSCATKMSVVGFIGVLRLFLKAFVSALLGAA